MLMLGLIVLLGSTSALGSLPAGVHPDLSAHYRASGSQMFHCLDGSGSIPWDQLNDDYCDCKVRIPAPLE